MRTLRLEDYEKMARDIVGDFINNEVSLVDGVAKTADEEGLNPDQTKNLVQLSNVIAHLKLFDKKDDGDKNVEFEPADPDDVMKKIYKPEKTPETPKEEGSDVDLSPFPDLMRMIEECCTPLSEETSEKATETTSPRKRGIMIIRIRKVAEELKNRNLEARHRYTEGIDKLAMQFRKLYGPDHATFEKEGYVLFNARAVPVFNDIRHMLKKPAVSITEDNVKMACVVDSETPLMKSFVTAIVDFEEAQLCTDGVRFLDEKIGALL